MKKNVADKWVKALRSGEYEQTVETLQDAGGYCCLGVLCRVGEKLGVTVDSEYNELGGDTLEDQPDILEWSGLKSTQGSFGSSGVLTALTALNDNENYDFNKLADTIEENWEQL